MTDPIADMLTRIRNAQAVKKETVDIPYSKIKWDILEILLKNKFIEAINKIKKKNKALIEIKIKYNKKGQSPISKLNKISKSSRRVYIKSKDIWPDKRGFILRILSTPKGILTDREAKKLNVGGEVLLEIW